MIRGIKMLFPVILVAGAFFIISAYKNPVKKESIKTSNSRNLDFDRVSVSDSLYDGKQIYDEYCASGHGNKGNGEGAYAYEMKIKPTDFTSGMIKFKSTPYGTLPTVEDIVSTLRLGVRTTAMIPQLQLNNVQMHEVAKYVLSFAPKGEKIGLTINIPPKPGVTNSLVSTGEKLFDVNCISCHGKDAKGDGPSAKKLVDYKGKPILPANLTYKPLKRGNSPEWIYKIISNGIEGTPMISYYGVIKPEEIWDVVYYIDSITKVNLADRNRGGMMEGMNGMMGGRMGRGLVG
jgi:mono/diheme cytochrome c family protein